MYRKRLVIIGAGGHGKVVVDTALSIAAYNEVVFVDARFPELSEHFGFPVVGDDSAIESLVDEDTDFVVAIGNDAIRAGKYTLLKANGARMPSYVHPSAILSSTVTIGAGTVVFPRAVINASAVIGDNVIINTGAIVEHDCVVASHSHVGPGVILTGGCVVGEKTMLGAGCIVCPGVEIADGARVGAGAVVTGAVAANTLVVGVPAVAK
jgi:sugar O-acyltransferase (sialic acid O-acetyltransferase NeuD family)